MKILFEEYCYKTEDVKGILGSFILSELDLEKETQQLKKVGYLFNKEAQNEDGTLGDLVFILPKVLIDEDGTVFGLNPTQLLNFNMKDWKSEEYTVEGGKLSKKQVYDFIYGFSTWIYRAVDIYRHKQSRKLREEQDEDAEAQVMTSVQVGQSGRKENATFMDVLLSLLDFSKTHKDFITFVIKIAHSGLNKISWPKTIANTQPILQDGVPVYTDLVNKKRVINFDEELLIIYFSILDYIHNEYGFPIPPQPGYKLIKGALFKSYMKSQGKTRLLRIRYKYYSDAAVLLWNLCFAFFDKADQLKAQTNRKDYLLVNKFETVFEGMVDELLGDKDLPHGLKSNDGGDRRIDHLYTYKHLLENLDDKLVASAEHNIYNIADSKYYKRDGELRGHDVPKQFQYASMVAQWHMDLLHDLLDRDKKKASRYKDIPLYDNITEGFNVIPNFFISALVDSGLDYDKENFHPSTLGDGSYIRETYFYWERLFHERTLFTLHYDVNFLYILKKYAQNKSYDKAVWMHEVREKFRQGILEHLNDAFNFYQILIPSNDIPDFVDSHFRLLTGKIFSFVPDEDCGRVLLYAERKEQCKPQGGFKFDEGACAHISNRELVLPGRTSTSRSVVSMKLGESKYTKVEEAAVAAEQQPTAEEVAAVQEERKQQIPYYTEIDPSEEDNYIRLYTIKAACGWAMHQDEEPDILGWVKAEDIDSRHKGTSYFIVQAQGLSMYPAINDGQYCLFQIDGALKSGNIVLAAINDWDSDYSGRFTIKELQNDWKAAGDGRERVGFHLRSVNSGDFPVYDIDSEYDEYVGICANFVKALDIDLVPESEL